MDDTATNMPRPEPATSPRAGTNRLAALAWGAVLVGLATWSVGLAFHGRGGDFAIFVEAARRFLEGSPIYRLEDGAMPFKYAPPSVLLFIPFVGMPLKLATALWNVLLVAGLAASAPLLRELLAPNPPDTHAKPGHLALTLALVLLVQSFFLEFFYGQVNLLMLVLLIVAAAVGERDRPWLAGAFWAAAVLLKPTAVLLGLWFIARRRWRVLATGPVTGVVAWVPIALRYGAGGMAGLIGAWAETLSRTTAPWMLEPNTQGVPSLVLMALRVDVMTGAWGNLGQIAALVICAGICWACRRSPARMFAVISAAVAISSALAWRANLVLALPLVALAFAERAPVPRRIALGTLAALCGSEFLLHESILGFDRVQGALRWRPFGVSLVVLMLLAAGQSLLSRSRAAADGHGRGAVVE